MEKGKLVTIHLQLRHIEHVAHVKEGFGVTEQILRYQSVAICFTCWPFRTCLWIAWMVRSWNQWFDSGLGIRCILTDEHRRISDASWSLCACRNFKKRLCSFLITACEDYTSAPSHHQSDACYMGKGQSDHRPLRCQIPLPDFR
jgi:hypothetical protein